MGTTGCAILILLAGFVFTSCNLPTGEREIKHEAASAPNETQLNLADSSKLIKISEQFYRNQNGHLYERTFAQREATGTESFIEYFNGKIPQDIDPLTFAPLAGWYAKDKHSTYYYRPTSGGMLIIKLDKADSKSFKLLEGSYLFAIDKYHVFKDGVILENVHPLKLRIKRDEQGGIVSVK